MKITDLKTPADIHALTDQEIEMFIAEHIFQWENVIIQDGVFGKHAVGLPFPEHQKTPTMIPNTATSYSNMGDLISIMVEDNRLALTIDRVNKVSFVSLYDKSTDKEYVSTHHDHRTVPRLLCEAALMYVCGVPYEQVPKETNLCDMLPLPSGDNRQHVQSLDQTEEHIDGLAANKTN